MNRKWYGSKQPWPNLKYCPVICIEGIRKTTKNLQYIWSFGLDYSLIWQWKYFMPLKKMVCDTKLTRTNKKLYCKVFCSVGIMWCIFTHLIFPSFLYMFLRTLFSDIYNLSSSIKIRDYFTLIKQQEKLLCSYFELAP